MNGLILLFSVACCEVELLLTAQVPEHGVGPLRGHTADGQPDLRGIAERQF